MALADERAWANGSPAGRPPHPPYGAHNSSLLAIGRVIQTDAIHVVLGLDRGGAISVLTLLRSTLPDAPAAVTSDELEEKTAHLHVVSQYNAVDPS